MKKLIIAIFALFPLVAVAQGVAGVPFKTPKDKAVKMLTERFGDSAYASNSAIFFTDCEIGGTQFKEAMFSFCYYKGNMVLSGATFKAPPTTDYEVHNKRIETLKGKLEKKYKLREVPKDEGQIMKNCRVLYMGGAEEARKAGISDNKLFMIISEFGSSYDSFTCQMILQYGPYKFSDADDADDF